MRSNDRASKQERQEGMNDKTQMKNREERIERSQGVKVEVRINVEVVLVLSRCCCICMRLRD